MFRKPLSLFVFLAIAALPLCLAFGDDAKKKPQVKPVRVLINGGFFPFARQDNPAELLRNPKVQQELKLDEEQKTKIQELTKEANAQSRNLFKALKGLKGQERKKKRRELNDKSWAKNVEADKKLQKLLKPEQAARLRQILIQQKGLQALSDQKVADELKITAEQKTKIADVQTAAKKRRQQLDQDLRFGNVQIGKYREKAKEISKEMETKTMDVLTKEQKAQFEKMKGEKFAFQRRFRIQLAPIRAIPLRKAKVKKIEAKLKKIKLKPVQQNG